MEQIGDRCESMAMPVRLALGLGVALGIAVVGCGGSDEGGDAGESGVAGDAEASIATAVSTPQVSGASTSGTPTIELIGWSRWPFEDAADEVVSLGIDQARPPSALRVRVCAGPDVDVFDGGASSFTFGDEAGEPFESPSTMIIDPLVSPVLLEWPSAGDCAEGWVQPNLPVGAAPATALWGLDPETRWSAPLGTPYQGADHPVDGELLDGGDSLDVGGGASWTVFGVERVAAADDAELIPADAPFNAGLPFDQPPTGAEWAVVDAEYCFGDRPGTFSGNLGLVVDGWATGAELSDQISASNDHLASPPSGEPCQRSSWIAAVPVDASITGITSTFGAGPWWAVSG